MSRGGPAVLDYGAGVGGEVRRGGRVRAGCLDQWATRNDGRRGMQGGVCDGRGGGRCGEGSVG